MITQTKKTEEKTDFVNNIKKMLLKRNYLQKIEDKFCVVAFDDMLEIDQCAITPFSLVLYIRLWVMIIYQKLLL